jgi:hypothetical protein
MNIFLLAGLVAVSVTTAQYDNARSGANTSETLISKTTLPRLGLQATLQCATQAGLILNQTQVLIQEGVTISGIPRTVAVMVTSTNDICVFDADPLVNGMAPYWQKNVGTVYVNIYQTMGCQSTPVIDPTTNVLYVVCVKSDLNYYLYALNLADGTDYHAPVVLAGMAGGQTFAGAGLLSDQRAGLALSNGHIYIGYIDCESGGSVVCANRGGLLSYDKTTLAQLAYWPLNAVWMSGGAPAIDSSGNLYVVTGNDTYNGTTTLGESIVKLNSNLVVQDWFTQSNWSTLGAGDCDTGSSRAILLSDTRLIAGSKDGQHFLLDTTNMGHLQGGGGQAPIQILNTPPEREGIAFANNTLFVGTDTENICPSGAVTKQVSNYAYSSGTFGTKIASTSGRTFQYSGTVLAYSSNGSDASTGLLWSLFTTSTAAARAQPAVFCALDPVTMVELWCSDGNSRDAVGVWSNLPQSVTVANGHVYVPNGLNQIKVYGLNAASPPTGTTLVAHTQLEKREPKMPTEKELPPQK